MGVRVSSALGFIETVVLAEPAKKIKRGFGGERGGEGIFGFVEVFVQRVIVDGIQSQCFNGNGARIQLVGVAQMNDGMCNFSSTRK